MTDEGSAWATGTDLNIINYPNACPVWYIWQNISHTLLQCTHFYWYVRMCMWHNGLTSAHTRLLHGAHSKLSCHTIELEEPKCRHGIVVASWNSRDFVDLAPTLAAYTARCRSRGTPSQQRSSHGDRSRNLPHRKRHGAESILRPSSCCADRSMKDYRTLFVLVVFLVAASVLLALTYIRGPTFQSGGKARGNKGTLKAKGYICITKFDTDARSMCHVMEYGSPS